MDCPAICLRANRQVGSSHRLCRVDGILAVVTSSHAAIDKSVGTDD